MLATVTNTHKEAASFSEFSSGVSSPELKLFFCTFLLAGKECIERRLTALQSGLCV